MPSQPILRTVKVEGLFGYLNYTADVSRQSNLSLLYGENGTGKTTLLRLIYAALSPNPAEGLRTYLLALPFRHLEITTSVGATVVVQRPTAEAGPYSYLASTKDGQSECLVDGNESRKKLEPVIGRLKQFDFDVHFLSDHRLLRSTAQFFQRSITKTTPRRREADGDLPTLLETAQGEVDRTWLDIETTAEQVVEWFRQVVFEQGNLGRQNINNIYLDLTKALVSGWRSATEPTDEEYSEMLSELDRLRDRAAPLLKLRTIAPVPFDEFKSLLGSAPTDRRADLARILTPFIESNRAILDALEQIAHITTLLITELNSFFRGKNIDFDVYQGFLIEGRGGNIPLTALSSGEKQLFLLLCSAFLSRQSRCVFLIDEPELSLNVYWQRNLPRTLQRLVDGARTQYLLATHSLEILTEFRESISNLDSSHAAT